MQAYTKPAKSNQQLIQHMQAKGLQISDQQLALDTLKNINYYRFKIYLVPFWNEAAGKYYPNARFEDALQLYHFDNELREIVFSRIGNLEIALRTKLDQTLTQHTNNPFWYLGDQLFLAEKLNLVNETRNKIAQEFSRSKLAFAEHYRSKYYNQQNQNYAQLPPFWQASELSTFGNLLTFYSALNKPVFKNGNNLNKLDELANKFGATNLKELNNWLLLIRDVRNLCAHHSRLWNVNLRAPQGIVKKINIQPARNNRIYTALIIMQFMTRNIAAQASLTNQLQQLLNKYPIAIKHLQSAGVPNNWHQDSIWK